MKWIDNLLNRITMYRVVLYYLVALWVVAILLGGLGFLPYAPADIIFSGLFILFVCWLTNEIFSKIFQAPTNVESVYITAFILALIITPLSVHAIDFSVKFWFLIWACVWAIASKFIFAIKKKHIFNPAAFGVALTALTIHQSASWWVGSAPLLPFVFLGGLLVVHKIRRFDLIASFFLFAFISIAFFGFLKEVSPLQTMVKAAVESPLFFFAFAMLSEPLTTPPSRSRRVLYGGFVGLIFSPAVHVGSFYLTPEIALLLGNILSYALSPKFKLVLTLQNKTQMSPDTYDFSFAPDKKIVFYPGQYLEWTLPHARPDVRGNRRYFTIASSPTETAIHMGVKFYPQPSSFKRTLLDLNAGDEIVASQLAGDFILPRSQKQKLIFIAGGIGITPFVSMTKYLIDKNEKRDIVLFYSVKTEDELCYRDVFEKAYTLGVKPIYVISDKNAVSSSWSGKVGRINAAMIEQEVPDYQDRMFYLSGPRSLVVAFEDTLREIGISRKNIKTDFFPGFA